MGGKKSKPCKIATLGLDNSGKTTIINLLKGKARQGTETAPTVGCSLEEFTTKKVKFQAFDLSGHMKYRPLWDQYLDQCDVILFVIDSTDTVRFGVAREEFAHIFEHAAIQRNAGIPVLVLANKSDLAESVGPTQLMDVFGLESITNRPWNIMATCALTGEGVYEGIDWIIQTLR